MYLPIIEKWRRKKSTKKKEKKNAVEARNWTHVEAVLLCAILVDPMNGFLQTLESKALKKAPAREVFASILQVLNEASTEEGFAIKNSSSFNEKKPFKDLYLDVKKLQSKYNNIKTDWRKCSDRQKNGSGLAPEKLPKWFDITNPVPPDKNQGLDNIASCPEDTLILNAAEDSDSGEDSDKDHDQEINIEQEINQADNEIDQGNVVDKTEENVNNVKKPFVNRTTKEGHLGIKLKC